MDLTAIIKQAGADKPKQTRPHDAKWQNNAIQYRTTYNGGETWSKWHFWNFSEHVADTTCPKEWDFVDCRAQLDTMRKEHDPEAIQFRMVAILEVF